MKPTAPLAMQVQRACHDTLLWLISFSLDGSVITYRLKTAAARLVSGVASIVVTVLASVCSAHVLDGHVCEHCAWPLVGCSSVSCWFRSCRIHHPAGVDSRASDIVRRQHRFLVRRFSSTREMLSPKPSNQSMKPTAPLVNKFSVFAMTPCRGLSLSR